MLLGFENIEVVLNDRVALLKLARPEKLNPLNWPTIKELLRAIVIVEETPGIGMTVITGSGRSFSSGGDLAGYIDLYKNPDMFRGFLSDFAELTRAIENSRRIYVAAVNGICVAGGLELILACDLIVAADTAKIGDGHLNFGQLPGAGGSQRLPRAIGLARAKALLLSGEMLDAPEALRIGLVNKVVPAADLDSEIKRLSELLLTKSAAGLAGGKHLLNASLDRNLAEGLLYEIEYVHRYVNSEADATEGLMAFSEKRKPRFTS